MKRGAAKHTIGRYNAVLKALRREHGLSLKEARAAWRNLKGSLDRTPLKKDIQAHPRISARAAKAAKAAAEKKPAGRRAPRVPREEAAPVPIVGPAAIPPISREERRAAEEIFFEDEFVDYGEEEDEY